ncbi:MAG: CoA transferase, partial [Acidimicrobiia bacterium]
HVAVGAIEPQFWAELLARLGLSPEELADPAAPERWAEGKARLAEIFRTRTRDEWCAALEGTDACLAPVLSLAEAPDHPHLAKRTTFVKVDGRRVPAPAPRFSRTPPAPPRPSVPAGRDTDAILAGAGFEPHDIARLRAGRVVE